jgi:hypothetical protein
VLAASFFAAFMAASAYGYYSYKFSRLNFVDFGEWVFYTGDGDIFEPNGDMYAVLFYSALQEEAMNVLRRVNNAKQLPVLAIDLSQSRQPSINNVVFVTAGINTLLPLLRRFNITHSPSLMLIKREKGALYKQATLVEYL